MSEKLTAVSFIARVLYMWESVFFYHSFKFSVLYMFCKMIKYSFKILAFVVVLLEIINF